MQRRNDSTFAWLTLAAALTASAQPARAAGNLSQEAIYHRCYQHIVGKRAPAADPGLASVRAGAAPAVSACQALLDRAALKADGSLANAADDVAKQILQNLANFHRTWFRTTHVRDSLVDGFDHMATADVIDGDQGALLATNALFHPTAGFASLTTAPNLLVATRVRAANSIYANLAPQSRIFIGNADALPFLAGQTTTRIDGVDLSLPQNTQWSPMIVQVGELVGIQQMPPQSLLPKMVINTNLSSEKLASAEPGLTSSIDVNRTWGGGVIGSQAYLLMNWGHGFDFVADGAVLVPRRWGINIYQDLLCRALPTLRQGDALPYVVGAAAGVAPFRVAAACVRCHASMDQTAYAARNLRLATSDDQQNPGIVRTVEVMTEYAHPGGAAPNWSATPVADFNKSGPGGRLFYRSYDGALVNKPAVSIADLGAKIAETNDLYVCAAKRYFKHFTGVDVSLHDIGDSANEETNALLTEKDWEYRKFVIALGLQLKKTGSLRAMVKDILASKYYQQSDYGRTAPAEAP